eukprot:NODE_205_length_14851_cov_0.317584.p9 type:complete len:124 gc:universal NODE_205_length_14851_cov_0.317584:1974-2345(+)
MRVNPPLTGNKFTKEDVLELGLTSLASVLCGFTSSNMSHTNLCIKGPATCWPIKNFSSLVKPYSLGATKANNLLDSLYSVLINLFDSFSSLFTLTSLVKLSILSCISTDLLLLLMISAIFILK